MATLRILLVAIATLVVTTGRASAADDFGPGESGLEDQLKQGISLRRAGNDEAALAVFLDAEKRAPDSVRVLLHITTAAQATGKWTMAYEYMQKAAGHKDEPYYQRHKTAIDNVEKTIALRVSQFRARGTPAGAEVRLNGEIIGTLPLTSIRPMEVGSYVLEVYKAGYYPLRRTVTVAGGGGLTQEAIELRERSPSLAAGLSGPAVGDGGATAEPVSPLRARWITWTLTGVALAAAATSGTAFVLRERAASHWNDDSRCLDRTNPMRTREMVCGSVHDQAKLAEGIGIGAGIAAVALGSAALVHWLSTARSDPGTDATPRAQTTRASCGAGLGSVVCYGTF